MTAFSWYWTHPLYLLGLPVCLLPLGLALWPRRRRGLAFPRVSLLLVLLQHPRQYARHSLALLRGVVCAGVLLALARPWTPSTLETVLHPNPEVLVVLDVSRSMRADDVAPHRLGAAKQLVTALAARHPGSRFGLVVFAGGSQARVPLTDDLEMFSAELAGTEVTDAPGEGTAIGDALALGLERLEAAGRPGPGSLPWPVLILITDGANHLGQDPEAVAARLGQAHVGFGVVGMGVDRPTVRREWDEVAQARRPLQDVYGRVQTWEPLDAAGLQRLAARAQTGLFVRGDDPGAVLGLDPLWKPSGVRAGKRAVPGPRREWFWLPLGLALLALGFEFMLAKTVFHRLQDV